MKRVIFSLSLLLLIMSNSLLAQSELRTRKLETTWVEGEVIGVLPTDEKLAVLQLSAADSTNSYELQVGKEILVEFYFLSEAAQVAPELPQPQAGDRIRAELAGTYNPQTSQYDFRVFRFSVIHSPVPLKEDHAAPRDD